MDIVDYISFIVGLFAGYFLKVALYERQRRDEIIDRDYKRRLSIKDLRISEARTFLDNFEAYLELLINNYALLSYYFFLEEDKEAGAKALIDDMDSSLAKLIELGDETKPSMLSLTLLNDEQLNMMQNTFTKIIISSTNGLFEVLDKVKIDHSSATVPDEELRELSNLISEGRKTLTKMELRLDEIAQKD